MRKVEGGNKNETQSIGDKAEDRRQKPGNRGFGIADSGIRIETAREERGIYHEWLIKYIKFESKTYIQKFYQVQPVD